VSVHPPPDDIDGVWDWLGGLSKLVHEAAAAKAERKRLARIAARSTPAARARRLATMKATHERRMAEIAAQKAHEAYLAERERSRAWVEDGCQCAATPRPPCRFCEECTEEEFEAWQASRK